MKRLLSIILGVLVSCVAVISSLFLAPNNFSSADEPIVEKFYEENITNKTDLISPMTSSVVGAQVSKYQEETPFDPEADYFRAGYAITPSADEYNQVKGFSTSFASTKLNSNQSFFLWVYLPCGTSLNLYTLTISITGTKTLTFTYDNKKLYDEIGGNGKGWCLFELNPKRCDTPLTSNELEDATFSGLRLTYLALGVGSSDVQSLPLKVSNIKLSIFHLFSGDSTTSQDAIIFKQNYSIYKANPNYKQLGSEFYIGDSITLSKSEIFEYVIVGKYNLLKVNLIDFRWGIELLDSNSSSLDVEFGDKIDFTKNGWFNLSITISETNHILNDIDENLTISEVVFKYQKILRCDQFEIGTFSKDSYNLEVGDIEVILFKFSSSFSNEPDSIKVKISDENIAEILESKIAGNTIYITIKAKAEGKVSLMVESNGSRDGDEEIQSFQKATIVRVNDYSSSMNWKIGFVWVILGIYVVAIVVIIVIFLVKSKKNSVK